MKRFFVYTGVAIILFLFLVAQEDGCSSDDGSEGDTGQTPAAAVTEAADDGATEPTEAPPEPTEAPERDDLNLTLGETAKVGDAEVTAHSFRLDSGGEFFAPDPGNVWIVVDATIVNTGDDEYNFSSLLQLVLRDTEGREYDVTFGPDIISQLDGTILAADNLRGEVAFEVPEIAIPGLQFVFKQVFGSGQARWNLN